MKPLGTGVSPHFWLRRIHSLSGIFPIGFFVIEHMFSNAFILRGPEAYDAQIKFLQGMPFVVFLEIVFIALPILYHSIYGLYIGSTGKGNLAAYPYPKNFLYSLQRWSGYVALVYVAYHAYHTRIVNGLYGTEINYARMVELMQIPFMFWFYIIGLAAVMFHFANGIWGFLVTWGFTVSQRSQALAGVLSAGLGILVFAVGVASLMRLTG